MDTAPLTAPAPPTTNGARPEQSEADKKALDTIRRLQRIEALRSAGWKLDLSGGQSATLCDPATLTERQRRAFKTATVAARRNPQQNAAELVSTDDQLIAMFLRSWTLSIPLPSPTALDALQDLAGLDFDRLVAACTDLMQEAFLDQEVSMDPASPFDGTPA